MSRKSSKKRQKALQRKVAKRKRKRKLAAKKRRPIVAHPLLRAAANWPLHECLLTRDWRKEGTLVQILVARRSPSGQIAAGAFLVDLGCLGVKSAFASLFDSKRAYEQKLRRGITERQAMMEADLNLVAKIIREGIAYARRLGFNPDPDYREATVLLGDANPDACDVPIPLGSKDGKPLFIAGPYDDMEQIMAKLEKAVGPDGFYYLVPLE